jgi:hypothetical protein
MSAANYRRPTPEFLKRDSAGATRADFERCLYVSLGIAPSAVNPHNEDQK